MTIRSTDPFRVCAWLQYAYLMIHPFGDGNGRVARIISSIPLLRVGLPPVIVSVESAEAYFEALRVVCIRFPPATALS